MAAAHQRAPERDRGEGMARVPERGEQESPPWPGRGLGLGLGPSDVQTSSASSRIIRLRSSGSKAIAEQISVPTPASR